MRTIAIVIPTYKNPEMLRKLLASINSHKTKHTLYTVVVDNGGDSGTKTMLAEWQEFGANRFVVRPGENLGYGQGINEGIAFINSMMADSKIEPDILVLNDDMTLSDFCVDNLADVLDTDEDAGIVGGKLFYPDGLIQHAGAFFNAEWWGYHYGQGRRASDYVDTPTPRAMIDNEFVTGAMLLIRGEVLKIMGGFDKNYGLGYYEDADLCFRVRDEGGWKIVYTPHAHAIHYEGQTSKHMGEKRNEMLRRNRNTFISKHAVPDWEDNT